MASDVENILNKLEDDARDTIQHDIDDLKKQAEQPVLDTIKKAQTVVTKAQESQASLNNLSNFTDWIKKNVWMAFVIIGAIVFLVVKKSKSGRK